MARTLDPTSHAVRRDAFLDAAEALIRTKGYESTSIQDILDAVGASRGAFYHYFDSKGALLEAVVDRMTDTALALVEPLAREAETPAVERLQAVFATAGRWKTERSDLLMAFMRSWYSEHNDLVRLRTSRAAVDRLTPLIADLVREGVAEGSFTCSSPDDAAVILMALFTGSGEAIGRLVLDRQARRVPFGAAERFIDAYEEAIERILGLPAGSFVLVDPPALRTWFA